MVLYLSIIGVTVAILSVINGLLDCSVWGLSSWLAILPILGCVVYEFAVDGLFATIVKVLPNKWFKHDNKFYNVGKKERKFYEKIKIKQWKDKVWELGGMGGFSKSKIVDPNSPEYLKIFLTESYKGELIHIIGIVVGFSVILIIPFEFIWTISFPVAIVNMFLNWLSTCVLRYNTPKLKVALERAQRLENRHKDN